MRPSQKASLPYYIIAAVMRLLLKKNIVFAYFTSQISFVISSSLKL